MLFVIQDSRLKTMVLTSIYMYRASLKRNSCVSNSSPMVVVSNFITEG